MRSSSFLSTTLTAILLLDTNFVDANCTSWKNNHWGADDSYGFSNEHTHAVETLLCPKQNNESCTIPLNTYQITPPTAA
jgi:hypothetical protein